MQVCTFRSKWEYYWMESVAVWDKRREDEEVSRAICDSPTEEKGWDGEREALSLSEQTLKNLRASLKVERERKRAGGWWVRWRLQEGIKDKEILGKYAERKRGQGKIFFFMQ